MATVLAKGHVNPTYDDLEAAAKQPIWDRRTARGTMDDAIMRRTLTPGADERFAEKELLIPKAARVSAVPVHVWNWFDVRASGRPNDVVRSSFYEPLMHEMGTQLTTASTALPGPSTPRAGSTLATKSRMPYILEASKTPMELPLARRSRPSGVPSPSQPTITYPGRRKMQQARVWAATTWQWLQLRWDDHWKFGPRSIFLLPVMSPYSITARTWLLLMLVVDLVYTPFINPSVVAFCRNDFFIISNWCTGVEIAFGSVFMINLLLEFHMGVVLVSEFQHRLLMDGDLVAWHYVWRGSFMQDLVSILAFIFQVVLLWSNIDTAWASHLVGLLLLVRFVRVFRVLNTLFSSWTTHRLPFLPHLPIISVNILLMCYSAAVVIHFLACVIDMLTAWEGFEKSWMARYQYEFGGSAVPPVDILETGRWRQYLLTLYWVVTTLTTVGYGDLKPITVGETIVIIFIQLLSQFLFAVIIIYLTEALRDATSGARRANLFRKKIDDVTEWLQRRGVPDEAQHQVYAYYSEVWLQSQYRNEEAKLFEDLPHFLRTKVSEHCTKEVVAQLPLLRALDDEWAEVAARMVPREVPPGHDIFREGQPNTSLIVLQTGDVLVMRGLQAVSVSGSPALLGDSCLLADFLDSCKLRPYTLRALSTCHLWELPLAELQLLFKYQPELRKKMTSGISDQLANALAEHYGEVLPEPHQPLPPRSLPSKVLERAGTSQASPRGLGRMSGSLFTDLYAAHIMPPANARSSIDVPAGGAVEDPLRHATSMDDTIGRTSIAFDDQPNGRAQGPFRRVLTNPVRRNFTPPDGPLHRGSTTGATDDDIHRLGMPPHFDDPAWQGHAAASAAEPPPLQRGEGSYRSQQSASALQTVQEPHDDELRSMVAAIDEAVYKPLTRMTLAKLSRSSRQRTRLPMKLPDGTFWPADMAPRTESQEVYGENAMEHALLAHAHQLQHTAPPAAAAAARDTGPASELSLIRESELSLIRESDVGPGSELSLIRESDLSRHSTPAAMPEVDGQAAAGPPPAPNPQPHQHMPDQHTAEDSHQHTPEDSHQNVPEDRQRPQDAL